MGCFGKCGCAECCLTAEELADIASQVEIDIYTEIYDEFPSEPIDGVTVGFSSSDCCNVAYWYRTPGYSSKCRKTFMYQADESVQVSTKITKSKKYVMDPPMGFGEQTDNTCSFLDEFPLVSAADVCDEVLNCGTVIKTAQKRIGAWDSVNYSRSEFRVAIYQREMICEEGGDVECKYVVEVAQGIDIFLSGANYESLAYSYSTSGVHACCEGINGGVCITPASHSPEPDCQYAATLTNGWAGGNTVRYWLVKYKVYDTAEDIPSEIIFDPSDGWPCGEIGFCSTNDPSAISGPICFAFGSSVDPYETGTRRANAFLSTCAYCLDFGVPCVNALVIAYGEDESCEFDIAGDVECTNAQQGVEGDLYSGRSASLGQLTFDGISDVFYSLQSSNFLSGEGCFQLIPQEGCVFPEDRNECNWWDCANCITAVNDPAIPKYQSRYDTVDSYSLTQSYTTRELSSICVPFLRTKITLIP